MFMGGLEQNRFQKAHIQITKSQQIETNST